MGLMKKLTSAVVASSLVLGLVGTAFAAPSAEQNQKAFDVLSTYKVVQGVLQADGTVSPDLDGAITRAQLVTIIVRAFGQEETAKILAGASSFSDVPTNEWYAGYAALAKNIAAQKNIVIGYEDGTFRPNQNVTMVEALAFIMKFLGVAPGTGANWAADTISAAKDAGIITAADAEAYLADPSAAATRGNAFGLAYSIFSTAQVTPGKTVLTSYVDTEGPVLTINKPAEPTTNNATYTINGKVEGAVALYFGTEEITYNADGTFSGEVSLAVGANAISFSAVDLAGNTTTESFTITRNVGAAAAINAELSAATIAAGGEATLTFAVVDANGAAVEANAEDITITIGGSVASVDKATGKVVAGTTAGAGTITVAYGDLAPKTVDVTVVAGELAKVSTSEAAVAPGAAVTLTAVDAYGNVIEGATFSESYAEAFIDGNSFIASEAGQYTVTATVNGKTAEGTIGVYGDVAEFVVEAPTEVVANNATWYTFTVKAVDSEGNLVGNFDGTLDITTDLTAKSDNDYDMVDGVATLKYKAPAGLDGLDILFDVGYDDDDADFVADDITGTASVAGIAQVATSIDVDAPEWLPTSSITDVDVTVTVLDQLGKAMLDGAWEFDVTVSGNASLKSTSDDKAESLAIATGDAFDLYPVFVGDAGTATITVSYPGLKTGTDTIKAALPLTAYKLVTSVTDDETTATVDGDATATEYVEFTIQAVDRNGVPTTDYTGEVAKVVFGDLGSKANLWVAANADPFAQYSDGVANSGSDLEGLLEVDITNGVGTFKVASKQVDTMTVKVQDTATSGALKESAETSISFTAGDPAYVGFTYGLTNVLRSVGKATLTAQVYDEFGNKVAKSGVKVTFADGSANYDGVTLNGKAEDAEVETDANGVATVSLEMRDYVASVDVTITADDSAIAETASNLAVGGLDLVDTTTVQPLAWIPKTVSVDVIDAPYDATVINRVSSTPAGSYVYLKVAVKDNYGRTVTDVVSNDDYDFSVEASNDDLGLTGVDEDVEWTYSNGYYYSDAIQVTKAETLSFTVGLTNLVEAAEGTRAIGVAAGAVAGAVVEEVTDLDTSVAGTFTGNIEWDTDKVNEITLRLTDAYGNSVPGSKVTSAIELSYTGPEVRNANGIAYDTADTAANPITIAKGRTTVKLYVVAGAEDEQLVITGDGFTFTIN